MSYAKLTKPQLIKEIESELAHKREIQQENSVLRAQIAEIESGGEKAKNYWQKKYQKLKAELEEEKKNTIAADVKGYKFFKENLELKTELKLLKNDEAIIQELENLRKQLESEVEEREAAKFELEEQWERFEEVAEDKEATAEKIQELLDLVEKLGADKNRVWSIKYELEQYFKHTFK